MGPGEVQRNMMVETYHASEINSNDWNDIWGNNKSRRMFQDEHHGISVPISFSLSMKL